MSKKKIYIYSGFLLLVFSLWLFTKGTKKNNVFSETVKIALRDVGNKLLLTNQDSTSLILPIKELQPYKYKLTFNEDLHLEPNALVTIIEQSFEKAVLPNNYRVEVTNCETQDVAYSYQMSEKKEETIVPCAGRVLPNGCYLVNVRFIHKESFIAENRYLLLILLVLIIAIGVIDYFKSKSKVELPQNFNNLDTTEDDKESFNLGSFKFYPEQNKLVKAASEISLSKKECELLALFVAQPNQIIKREELTKKVWEDQGVFVGRSLDTYISKLRKILKEDGSIKLTNVHGVGYKLEVEK